MHVTEAERQQSALRDFVASGSGSEKIYGLQWGDPRRASNLGLVLDRFIAPNLSHEKTVLEIGAGGGRWTREFVGRAKRVVAVDAIPEYERAIRAHCDDPSLNYLVCQDGHLSDVDDRSIDWVFSFDSFVHFHPALFDAYVIAAGRVLKPGGLLHLHYARQFPQNDFDPIRFQYRDDEVLLALLRQCGMVPTGLTCEFWIGLGSKLIELGRTAD